MNATIAPFESESEAVRFQSEVSVMVIKIDHTPLTSSHSHNSRVTRSISRTHMTFFQQQAPEVLTFRDRSRRFQRLVPGTIAEKTTLSAAQ